MTVSLAEFLVGLLGGSLLVLLLVGLYAYYRAQTQTYNLDDLDDEN